MLDRFIDVRGVPTRCLVAGDETAPAVLLLHGVTLTADIWRRNIDALANGFRIVASDMLGHGFTRPASGQRADIPGKLDHLLRLADTLELDRFAVSASSYGALIAANLYLRAPDRVNRLVLNGSGSCFSSEADLAAFLSRTYESYRPRLTSSSPKVWRERLCGTVFDPASIPPELPILLSLCYAQPWIAACWEETITTMRDAETFRPYRILERLEAIDVETLVVWGREDRGAAYGSAAAAVKRMPRARLVAFECCGHLPMLEHPDPYNEVVRDFLGGARSARAA